MASPVSHSENSEQRPHRVTRPLGQPPGRRNKTWSHTSWAFIEPIPPQKKGARTSVEEKVYAAEMEKRQQNNWLRLRIKINKMCAREEKKKKEKKKKATKRVVVGKCETRRSDCSRESGSESNAREACCLCARTRFCAQRRRMQKRPKSRASSSVAVVRGAVPFFIFLPACIFCVSPLHYMMPCRVQHRRLYEFLLRENSRSEIEGKFVPHAALGRFARCTPRSWTCPLSRF